MINDYRFENGRFNRCDPVVSHKKDPDDQEDDVDGMLISAGFTTSQHFGEPYGLSFTLYESDNCFVVSYCTACKYCLISCTEWPDLIELLEKLSGPVLLGQTDPEEE